MSLPWPELTTAEWEERLAAVRRPRTAARREETALHRAADARMKTVKVAFQYAFAQTRKALRPLLREGTQNRPGFAQDIADRAGEVLSRSLRATLPRTLHTVVLEGGRVGVEELGRLRVAAKFNPNQPRDDHGQWTASGGYTTEMLPNKHLKITVPGGHIFLESQSVEGFLNIFTVKADTPRQGTGTKLYQAALTEAHKRGYTGISSLVNSRNDAARAVWNSLERRGAKIRRNVTVEKGTFKGSKVDLLLLMPSQRHAGGPGSGNFGHAGRLRTARDERPRFRMRFDVNSPEAIAWADRHAGELIDNISETTREAISNAVAEALETGDLQGMFDEILDAVGDEDRAELIARTESMTAVNEGQRQAWRQAVDEGLLTGEEKRTWIATGDESTCPICSELDGMTADMDGEYPDPGGSGPPAHPRCRCTEGLL